MANTTRGMPKDECAFGIRHDSYPLNTKSVFSVDLAMNCATTNKNICRVSLRSTRPTRLNTAMLSAEFLRNAKPIHKLAEDTDTFIKLVHRHPFINRMCL